MITLIDCIEVTSADLEFNNNNKGVWEFKNDSKPSLFILHAGANIKIVI